MKDSFLVGRRITREHPDKECQDIEMWRVLERDDPGIPQEARELFETLQFQVSIELYAEEELIFIRRQIAKTINDIRLAIQK